MDRTVANHTKLFDELLVILDKHRDDPGVEEAIADLRAAKINYAQGSTNQLVACIVLTIHDLFTHPPSSALLEEVKGVTNRFVAGKLEVGSKLSDLAKQYEASGGRALSYEEILREVDERRGASR
jgi:hypothetical protein